MRQLPKDKLLVDDEGFPQGTAAKGVDGRDNESGELIVTKIQYIRKRPELRVSPRIDSLLSADLFHPRLSEGRRFSGFRIQKFTRRSAYGGPWDGGNGPRSHGRQIQTCVYMKGGEPVHYTRRPLDPHEPTLGLVRREDYAVRQVFRVPRENLPQTPKEQPLRKPNTLCVNIWEEFLYGNSVIKTRQRNEEEEEEDEGLINYVRRILSRILPKFMIDLLVYITYFLLFFASCLGYNMFCELGCYILLAQHLKIHEKAYEKKIDVAFTGSIFQGPLYVLTRSWCEHCSERDRAEVIMKLMIKMKSDILPSVSTTKDSP